MWFRPPRASKSTRFRVARTVKINENIAFYVVSAGACLQKHAFSRGRTVKISENTAFYMVSAGPRPPKHFSFNRFGARACQNIVISTALGLEPWNTFQMFCCRSLRVCLRVGCVLAFPGKEAIGQRVGIRVQWHIQEKKPYVSMWALTLAWILFPRHSIDIPTQNHWYSYV